MSPPSPPPVPWHALRSQWHWAGESHVDARDESGRTPLLALLGNPWGWALPEPPTEMVKILIANGADVHVWDRDGGCPWAYTQALPTHLREEIMHCMKQVDVVPSLADIMTSMTALHWLAMRNPTVLPDVIHHFPTAHLPDWQGNTPLHVLMDNLLVALWSNSNLTPAEAEESLVDAWEALLQRGAQPDIANTKGVTVHELARKNGPALTMRWEKSYAAWQQTQLAATLASLDEVASARRVRL